MINSQFKIRNLAAVRQVPKFLILVLAFFLNLPAFSQQPKVIDQARQGEVITDVKTSLSQKTGKAKKFYIESYGCQMNFADSEVVASILSNSGYQLVS